MVVVVCVVAYIVFFTGEDEPTPEITEQDVARVTAMARDQLGKAVDAARVPISIRAEGDPAPDEIARKPELKIEKWQKGKFLEAKGDLAPNESVFLALQRRGLSNQAIHDVVSATEEQFDFRQSRPGDHWEANVDAEGNITRFMYQTSPEDIWETRRQLDGKYQCEKVEVPIDVKQEVLGGVVTSSLWQSMEQAGLSATIVGKFIDVFSHEVDFDAQTRPGDRFSVVFERLYLDGEELRPGRVLAAKYVTPEKTYHAYYYETLDDEQGYYDEAGNNLQRQFLKSPLTNVRLTSKFGKRFHPVLKRWKMHNGVDYGAPTGTPVMAVADGTVTWAGYKGANGKLVVIKHKSGLKTHYAHLSYIPRSIKPGVKVTKKTIIGKVGSTGRSTGPHLHFGVSRNDRFIDPLKVDFMRSPPLKGKELETFKQQTTAQFGARLDKAMNGGEQEVTNTINGFEEEPPLYEPDGAQLY